MPRVLHRSLPRAKRTRWARALLCATLLVPAALGGLPFFWCGPMAELRMHCCCPNAHLHPHAGASDGDRDAPVVTEQRRACCESRSIGSLPSSTAAHAQRDVIGASPVIAHLGVLYLAASVPAPISLDRNGADRDARAGPEPPTPETLRVYQL